MKIRIKETGEIKELEIRDRHTGCEYTAAMLEEDECVTYNHALEIYETDKDSYEWWDSMIDQLKHAEDVKQEYIEKYGADAVYDALAQYDLSTDLEGQPAVLVWALENAFGPLDN